MRELSSSIRVLMNLYEIGMKGFRRDNSYVVSTGGVIPSMRARARNIGDMVYIVEDETPEIADELECIYYARKYR